MLPHRHSICEMIPPEELKTYPAWLAAYDEEGVDGQNEATIKPNDLGDPALPGYVTAEVFFADGTNRLALIGGDFGVCSRDDITEMFLYHDAVAWKFDLSPESCEEEWPGDTPFFESFADLLPMRVVADLGAVFDGQVANIAFRVDAAGVVTPETPS